MLSSAILHYALFSLGGREKLVQRLRSLDPDKGDIVENVRSEARHKRFLRCQFMCVLQELTVIQC